MRRTRVYAAAAAVSFLAASGIAAGASWDHAHPGVSTHAEWVAQWECDHEGRDCGGPRPWHEGWHQRESLYTKGFAATAAAAALLGIAARGSRMRHELRH